MDNYRPSSIVVSLCRKLNAIPVAETLRPDGTVVIVVADGRKLTFLKDDITRTLTEAVGQGGFAPPSPRAVEGKTRKREKKEKHVE